MGVNTSTGIAKCSERTDFTAGNTIEPFRYQFNVMILCMLAGDLTLVLDFGRFVLDSDSSAAKLTTVEEASHYLFFRLIGRNISALLVDGHFDWDVSTAGYKGSDSISRQGRAMDALYLMVNYCGRKNFSRVTAVTLLDVDISCLPRQSTDS